VQVMSAHLTDPVPPPSQLRPGVPADLEAVVLRCLGTGCWVVAGSAGSSMR